MNKNHGILGRKQELRFIGWALICVLALACNQSEPKGHAQTTVAPAKVEPPPPILIDGSSTVFPISRGVLDLYASRLVTDVKIEVSGTGGGFKKFCRKETTLNGASRPMKSVEEKLCEENNVTYIELPVAFDGVAVVVPASNDWAYHLTTSELKRIWSAESEGTVLSWKDVRESFPDRPLKLFGPGLDSGTFDFFTGAINGNEGSSRADYESSEDDNELVNRVTQNENALGYFGLAYVQKNTERLRAIPIDDEIAENGDGPILPTPESVTAGSYQPLSRPLFLYVNKKESNRKEVRDFVDFYLKTARLVAPDVGYVGLPKNIFALAHQRLSTQKEGSAFSDLAQVTGLTLGDLLTAETESVASSPRANK